MSLPITPRLPTLAALVAASTLAACGGAAAPSASPAGPATPTAAARTYVLVHGAWMGAWAWRDVAADLEGRGARVVVVELPAHGADTTPLTGATLDAYVARVTAAIDAAGAPVVLVGHSLGGVVVTQAAEARPDAIARLVYVAAYVPKDGQPLVELAGADAASHVGPVLQIDGEHGVARLPTDQLADLFCADCAPAAIATLTSSYRDEPLAPFVTPVHTTDAGWGRVAKAYVYTRDDHAVSRALQGTMTAGLTLAASVELPTGHAPFLSQPAVLADALEQVAR